MAENVMTPEFRASYANLFEAKKNDLNGKMEYSVVAVFGKAADLSALKKAVGDAAAAMWGADKTKWPANLRSPVRPNAERAKDGKLPEGYEEGGHFITLKTEQKPGVVDANVNDIIDPREFYSGCYARATIRAFAYDKKGNRGVSFGLQNVQKTRDGESLSGRVKASAEFKPLEGVASAAGGEADPFA